jgi:hypothetical protein
MIAIIAGFLAWLLSWFTMSFLLGALGGSVPALEPVVFAQPGKVITRLLVFALAVWIGHQAFLAVV